MATKTQTFQTAKQLADFIGSEDIPRGQIIDIEHNASGHPVLTYDDGAFTYDADTGGGTVNVPADARVVEISCHAAGGDGTLTIGGGDSITVRSGQSFNVLGADKLVGAVALVFSATLDYYVSWTA